MFKRKQQVGSKVPANNKYGGKNLAPVKVYAELFMHNIQGKVTYAQPNKANRSKFLKLRPHGAVMAFKRPGAVKKEVV